VTPIHRITNAILILSFFHSVGRNWCTADEQIGPMLLDEHFVLPEGSHIYRAANNKLSGGSYAMAFDGQGRLLVGEGNSIRRLYDTDGDQVYDKFETIVDKGVEGRGPQGILVRGDRLYAVGGDGLQLYTGYLSGKLKHEGRLGEKFPTGGDHSALIVDVAPAPTEEPRAAESSRPRE